ncbi:hypothetical protein [Hyphococcus sp. DH-69]|uniref:hypothetical protein n=1 Tax=Hyphococcus formosus TaxID=3143534 RepID=UPI00398A6011
MENKPSFLRSGERARLFPVLAETSKEGRTLSVVLSSIAYVEEFGAALLATIGQRKGARTKIDVYTEIVFAKTDTKIRPDGLIVLTTGKRQWTALVEAKVGNADLQIPQIEAYLQLARDNGIDAVVTLSNQFTAQPNHHPLSPSKGAMRKVELYHWSWMFILTQATLQLSSNSISDVDQSRILAELVRFLSHPSTGVKGFERMPSAWTEVVAAVRGTAPLQKNSDSTFEVIEAWHQEVRDLCLIMSRLLQTQVEVKLLRSHRADPKLRKEDDAAFLASDKRVRCTLDIPDTANSIMIEADLLTRSIMMSMRLLAPSDRKSSGARLNWLIKQLSKTNSPEVFIRAIWPGKAQATQSSLLEVRENPDKLIAVRDKKMVVTSFEVLFIRELGGKFSGVRTFIEGVENAVPDFYENVGQHLKAWTPTAPQLKGKTEPSDVSPQAIYREAEFPPLDVGVSITDTEKPETEPPYADSESEYDRSKK